MPFPQSFRFAALAGFSLLAIGAATAQTTAPAAAPAAPATAVPPNPTVGGAVMDPAKPIAVNAAAAPNLTTLVKAATAAGLIETLSGPGPFTVFAPTDDAFGHIAPGTVDNLMKPASKATLAKILTYHVVPGALTVTDLRQKMAASGGTATLTTVEGEPLSVTEINGAIQLSDGAGHKSYIETADVRQSNGIVQVVNGVLLPKLN